VPEIHLSDHWVSAQAWGLSSVMHCGGVRFVLVLGPSCHALYRWLLLENRTVEVAETLSSHHKVNDLQLFLILYPVREPRWGSTVGVSAVTFSMLRCHFSGWLACVPARVHDFWKVRQLCRPTPFRCGPCPTLDTALAVTHSRSSISWEGEVDTG